MYLPPWAISAFGVVFFAIAALAGWALRLAGSRLQSDMENVKLLLAGTAHRDQVEKVADKVDEIDKRLVRVETLLNGVSCASPKYTPPVGVPQVGNSSS